MMTIERLVGKAQRLIVQRKVQRIDEWRYNVIGDHGTYNVVRGPDGKVSCNCLGFQNKKICSHVAAVLLLIAKSKTS